MQSISPPALPYLFTINLQSIRPYDSLYSMINQYLVTTYLVCENVKSTEALKDFITTSTDFIKGCPKTSVMILLKRIQEGIAAWTADPKEYMSNKAC